jgi:hypothetical protein
MTQIASFDSGLISNVLLRKQAYTREHTLACLASAGTTRGQNNPNRFVLFGSIAPLELDKQAINFLSSTTHTPTLGRWRFKRSQGQVMRCRLLI